jgi:hypothetical protein
MLHVEEARRLRVCVIATQAQLVSRLASAVQGERITFSQYSVMDATEVKTDPLHKHNFPPSPPNLGAEFVVPHHTEYCISHVHCVKRHQLTPSCK